MNQNYREGTWFAVPLRQGGYCTGVVARAPRRGPILLCYFFGPRRESVPNFQEVSSQMASAAILILRVGDLGLIRGDWPIIGRADLWNRSDWPMPVFVRREPLPPFRNWRVYYSETDPGETIKEELEPNERPDLPRAGSSGSGAAEIKLTALLKGELRGTGSQSFQLVAPPERTAASTPIGAGHFRAEVLQQLENFGSNISRPHRFDFYLYFSSETAALEAAEKICKCEFTAKVVPAVDADKWLCRANGILIPGSAPLDEINDFFEQIASSLDGEFDGWESDVVRS